MNEWFQSPSTGLDKMYGLKNLRDGSIVLGGEQIYYKTDKIHVDDESYSLTRGLGDLVFV